MSRLLGYRGSLIPALPVAASQARADHGAVAGPGDFRSATRIAVYGVTGSGKTRAAADIGAVTGLPWHAVDDLTWEPGWVEVPTDEQRRRIERICRGDAWILDSIYSPGWTWSSTGPS